MKLTTAAKNISEKIQSLFQNKPSGNALRIGPGDDGPMGRVNLMTLARASSAADSGDPSAWFRLAEYLERIDAHYAAVLQQRKNHLIQMPMRIETGPEVPIQARRLAEDFLESGILQEQLGYFLDAIGKGIAIIEMRWRSMNGRWLPFEFIHHGPHLFAFDQKGQIGLRDQAGRWKQPPPARLLTPRIGLKTGLPWQTGLARPAGLSIIAKQFAIRDWMTFLETYGRPIRLGRYGRGVNSQEKKELLNSVYHIFSDAAAIIPDAMNIEFIQASTRGSQEGYQKLAQYMDQQLSKLVLGQTTTTDAIAGGHAVSKEHDKVRRDIGRADARAIERCLNNQLMPWLIGFNLDQGYAGWPGQALPQFRIGEEKEEERTNDPRAWAAALESLTSLGVEISADEARRRLGLGAPQKGEAVLKLPTQQRTIAGGAEGAAKPDDRDWLAELAAETLTEWDHESITGPLGKVVLESQTYDDLGTRLATVADQIPTKKVENQLAQSLFASRLAGRVGVEEDSGTQGPVKK